MCCLRPIFPSVNHRAAGSGRPQVLRVHVPSVCPAAPLYPFQPRRRRRHADSDTNIPSGRPVIKLCHRRFLKPVAGLFDFQPYGLCRLLQRTSAPPSVGCRRSQRRFYPSLPFPLAHVGLYWPVRASAQRIRPQPDRLTVRRPGLRETSPQGRDHPPGVPPGLPGPGAKLLRTLCVQGVFVGGCLRQRA